MAEVPFFGPANEDCSVVVWGDDTTGEPTRVIVTNPSGRPLTLLIRADIAGNTRTFEVALPPGTTEYTVPRGVSRRMDLRDYNSDLGQDNPTTWSIQVNA